MQIPLEPLLVFLLVLVRVLFFFAFLPIFGELFLPLRIRMVLAMAVALVFAPLLFQAALPFPQTLPQMAGLLAREALLGFAFALVGKILFAVFQFAGQIVGEQIGFGMAQLIDPSQGGQMPVISQMFYVAAILLFFAVDAHHAFFRALGRSFEVAPPGALTFDTTALQAFFAAQGARLFSIAVQLSLPIVAVIFVTNAALGMVAKGVPQLNVFLESFPIRILVGLFLLVVVTGLLMRQGETLFATLDADLSILIRFFAR